VGNAYELSGVNGLAGTWSEAIDIIEKDERMGRILPAALIRNLVMTKRQELARFADEPPQTHWMRYLESV
jgi:glutamine synthetase